MSFITVDGSPRASIGLENMSPPACFKRLKYLINEIILLRACLASQGKLNRQQELKIFEILLIMVIL